MTELLIKELKYCKKKYQKLNADYWNLYLKNFELLKLKKIKQKNKNTILKNFIFSKTLLKPVNKHNSKRERLLQKPDCFSNNNLQFLFEENNIYKNLIKQIFHVLLRISKENFELKIFISNLKKQENEIL